MSSISPELLSQIRDRFAQIDQCPVQGPRVFFENAGGALTLNAAVETSRQYAEIPDNQGRDNPGSHELVRVINKAKEDMGAFMNAPGGQFFMGESGTELLFRLIMNACLGTGNGEVLGSTLEHPATRSACDRWSKIAGQKHVLIEHDNNTGTIEASAYASQVTPTTQVATIIHTSPVTGMGVDLSAIAKEIRKVAPECFIIVDGIQHAAHGRIDLTEYNIDGYVISPYKMFSRHGFGMAWISDRLTHLPHNSLMDGPELTDAMINGVGNLPGLAAMETVSIIGGVNNPAREGLVSLTIKGVPSVDVVKQLNERGIRTHLRKADHYSNNILTPLDLDSCVRVSMCHYNSEAEVIQFLEAMQLIAS